MFDLLNLLQISVMSPEWVQIVRGRDPYLFMTSWDLTTMLFFVAAAVFFAVSVSELKPQWGGTRTREIYLLLLAPLILSIISFITVDILHVSSFVQVQFYRSLVVWKVILTILFTYAAFRHVQRQPGDYLYNFFLIGLIASVVVDELLVLIFLPFFTLLWLERLLLAKRKNIAPKWDLPSWLQAALFLGIFFMTGIAACITRPFLWPLLTTTILITFIAVAITARPRHTLLLNTSAAATMVLLYASNGVGSPFSLYPAAALDDDFNHTCEWIKGNTQVTDIFVVEPFALVGEEVKLLCERNLFYSGKDGAQVLFDEQYAREWYRRRRALKDDAPSAAAAVDNILKENVDYILSERYLPEIAARQVFHNARYFIYDVR